MATRKKARARAVGKGSKKKSSKKPRALKKAAATTRSKRAAARKPKPRREPETLRIKSFTPSLTVSDLSRSLVFYTQTLGFFVSESWTEGDRLRGVMLKAGACELGLSQDDWKLGHDRNKGVGFRIWCDTAQDVDTVAGRLKTAGYALTEEPGDHPAWGVRSFSVDDPDGFHLTIARNLSRGRRRPRGSRRS
jgi:catechol 2,3-dioxygenase-like lactoylglutathione lyase family enzyme